MSTARSEPLALPGLPWPIELRIHPRARSLRLRLDEARGLLALTCPSRVGRRVALKWAQGQAEWVERQIRSIEPAEPFLPGATIPFEGGSLQLHWDERLPRTPAIVESRLQCGGPRSAFASRVERFLRAEACSRFSRETASAADAAGVTVRSVAVGDSVSRWGSCSASGAIRYNWRLILAPPHILRWVVAHEIAHRVHMNHGPEFRALEARLYDGSIAAARSDLRSLGPRLKRVGRPL